MASTRTFTLAPMPKWYIADLTGKPLAGGSMYTYRSLDKTAFKFVYQDPNGTLLWPDPILFDENGSQGPFYWEFDSANPLETYYIEVYDADGVLQWTIDQFTPPGGGGGGSGGSLGISIENLVVNNVMWRNLGPTPVAGNVLLKLAPGAHAALANKAANANGLYTGPDIYFIKNNNNATDTVSFPQFTLGSNALTGDVTPVDYFNYTCSILGTGETIKCVQFPITRSIQNLSNQAVRLSIWARANPGPQTLLLQWFQFTGDGPGAFPSATTPIQSITLTSAWNKTLVTANVPNVSGLTPLGGCGNDALFLQVWFPLSATCNIDFTMPVVVVGNLIPAQNYVTYDMIDGVINAQRTGYVTQGFDTTAPPGYVIMNDGSIGNAASAATTRANIDTFPLYNLLYNNVLDAWAPVSGGRSGDPIADFTGGKRLTLTRQLGRVLGGAGAGSGLTARALGEFLGSETHILSIAEMPSHNHQASTTGGSLASIANGQYFLNVDLPFASATILNVPPQGGGAAHTIMQPSAFMNFFIKL